MLEQEFVELSDFFYWTKDKCVRLRSGRNSASLSFRMDRLDFPMIEQAEVALMLRSAEALEAFRKKTEAICKLQRLQAFENVDWIEASTLPLVRKTCPTAPSRSLLVQEMCLMARGMPFATG